MRIKILKKILSVFVAVTFLFSNAAYATPTSRSFFKDKKIDYDKISNNNEDNLQQKKVVFRGENAIEPEARKKEEKQVSQSHLKNVSQIHIPVELGRIIEVYDASSNKAQNARNEIIVHIQDFHTNPEAELSLSGILEVLLKNYNLGLVCSEGADGAVDTSSVSNFPNYKEREETARLFVDSGELTGEEYLSITKYPDLPIWGMEDKDTYFKNIIQFNKIMKFNIASQSFISQAKKAIEELKTKIYSKAVLAIEQNETGYANKEVETNKYLEFLFSYASKLNISVSEYKNIAILIQAIAEEKEMDQVKNIKDSQNLLMDLQKIILSKGLAGELGSLVTQANFFKDQKISQFSFYLYLKDMALKYFPDGVSKYPNFGKFVDYLVKVNSLDTAKLFTEIEALTYDVKQRLAKTVEERGLIQVSRNIKFLEGFFNLKISNEEFEYYLNNKDAHKVAFFKAFLKPVLKKYNISAFIDFNPNLVDNHFLELENFYETVKKRDVSMVRNSLSEIEKRKVEIAAIVSGGFHTKGITKQLRDKGYSYVVISPCSATSIDEENYHALLSGKRKSMTELLKKLDLNEIINKFAGSLRVALAFDFDMRNAFISQVIPELAKIWNVSPEELIPENILKRIGIMLAFSDSAQDWHSPAVNVEIRSPKNDALVVKFSANEGGGEGYFSITKNGIARIDSSEFKGKIVAKFIQASENVKAAKQEYSGSNTDKVKKAVVIIGKDDSVVKEAALQSKVDEIAQTVFEATKGLVVELPKNMGILDIYDALKRVNIVWKQAQPRSPPIDGQVDVDTNTISLTALSLEKLSGLEIIRVLTEKAIELESMKRALNKKIKWTEKTRSDIEKFALNYIDKTATGIWEARDEYLRRARALRYVLKEEIELFPDFPKYDTLPKIKDPVFNVKQNMHTDIASIILKNEAFGDVIFGLRNAALVNLNISKEEKEDLEYALLIFKHIRGVGIRIMSMAQEGNYYVYNENYMRFIADKKDVSYATTRKGLEFLIKRDFAAKKGKYYDAIKESTSLERNKFKEGLAYSVIEKDENVSLLKRLEIAAVYIPTYERPDALDRVLTAQTANLKLFGHEYLPIIVVDSSVDKEKQKDDKPINYVDENLKVIKRHCDRGFDVRYVSSSELEAWTEEMVEGLYWRYNRQLRENNIDKRIADEFNDGKGGIDKAKIKEVLFASLSLANIAGKRTMIQVMTQGQKIACADDDSLPMTRIFTKDRMLGIEAERQFKIDEAQADMYRKLEEVSGLKIGNEAEFENLLAKISSLSPSLRKKINNILEQAYAYSEDGLSGLIPQAAGQILRTIPESLDAKPDEGLERRLRFSRKLHEDLPTYLITSEDIGSDTYKKLPDIDELTVYDWVPVDYLKVFDETLGEKVGSPKIGRVFKRDLRGIAGSLEKNIPDDRRVILATSHFSGDRDNSAESLFVQAMDKFQRDYEAGRSLETRYFQQVVRKAVFYEIDGSVSTLLHTGNQFCFNTTSLDNRLFPLPTTGAWLRIEEPFQFSLAELIMQAAMAWSNTVGGHERVPGSRRPKVEMQLLWEECAMVLYRELDAITLKLREELKGENDPGVRIKRLGEEYLKSAGNYKIPKEEIRQLQLTCERISNEVNRLYAFSEHAKDKEDKEELLSLFGIIGDTKPFGFIKQFGFAVYELEVGADGHTARYTRWESEWKHHWEPAKLVEEYEWKKVDTGTVDLSGIDWDNNPAIKINDNIILRVTPYKDVPRAKPVAGSKFLVAIADEQRQQDLIVKAEEVIKKQFIWDAQQLVLWPDILSIGYGFFDRKKLIDARKNFKDKQKANTLTVNDTKYLAELARDTFMEYYNKTGDALLEAVEIIAEIGSLSDRNLALPATKVLFGGIVMPLSDAFKLDGRYANYAFYPRLIQICRGSYPELDKLLNEFDIKRGKEGEAYLRERALEHAIDDREFKGDKSKVKKVFVLTRANVGGEVAITSILMEKAMQAFPNTDVVLLADKKTEQMFGGNSKINIVPVPYKSKGMVLEDLGNWLLTFNTINDEVKKAGLKDGEYVIIDNDSRVTRLGILPLIKNREIEKGYHFFLRTMLRDEEIVNIRSLGEDTSLWADRVFGINAEGKRAYPALYLRNQDMEYAKKAFDLAGFTGEFVVSLNFGVSGANEKRISDQFEVDLILALLDKGVRIMLDKGFGEEEETRTSNIIRAVRSKGIAVEEFEENEDLSLRKIENKPMLISFKGGMGKFASLVKESSLYISYDSQGQHVAAALDKPVIAIFAGYPVEYFPDRWRPYARPGVEVEVIRAEHRKTDEAGILAETLEKLDNLRAGVNSKLVMDRRKNIQFCNDVLDPAKPYKGYDVYIITSTTEDERRIQEETFKATFGQRTTSSGSKVMVLSVLEDYPGGAGNFLGTMYAYLKAAEEAKNKYGVDLFKLWKEKDLKIAVMHNGGDGKRCSPLTGSEGNSRGAIKMVGSVESEGKKIPLTLLLSVAMQNSIFAESNDGNSIDVFWSSQIYFGTNDLTKAPASGHLLTKLVQSIDKNTPLTPSILNDLGMFEIDGAGNALRFKAQSTFKDVTKAREWLASVEKGAFDLGSHRMKRELFAALLDFYGGHLEAKDLKRNLDPQFTQPLIALLEGLRASEGADKFTDEDEILKAMPKPLHDKLVSFDTYSEVIKFYLKYRNLASNISDWVGIFDIGSQIHWWRHRRPLDILNDRLSMVGDVAGEKIQILQNGADERHVLSGDDKIEAQDLRLFRNIHHPIVDSVIGGKLVTGEEYTFEDVAKGITINGVYIKGSIIYKSKILDGSKVINSVISESNGEIDAVNSSVENSDFKRMKAENALVYNLSEQTEDELSVKSQCVSDVFRKAITGTSLADKGKARFYVPFNVDGSASDEVILPGNRYSFSQIRNMKDDIAPSYSLTFSIGEGLPATHLNIELPDLKIMNLTQKDALRYEIVRRIYNRLVFVGPGNLTIEGDFSGYPEAKTLFEEVVDILTNENNSFRDKEVLYERAHHAAQIASRIHRLSGNAKDGFTVKFSDKENFSAPVAPIVSNKNRVDLLAELKKIEGIFIGIDVGGTDIKVVAVKDNISTKLFEREFGEKEGWKPDEYTKAEQYMDFIKRIIREVREVVGVNKEISGIGISWPDMIIDGMIVGGDTGKTASLGITARNKKEIILEKDNRSVNWNREDWPENEYWSEFNKLSNMAKEIEKEYNVPVAICNDGNITAFWAAVELEKGNILGVALGTSPGAGYVDENGNITPMFLRASNVILNSDRQAGTGNKNTGILDAAQQHLAQTAAFRLAKQKGIKLTAKTNAGKLEELQLMTSPGSPAYNKDAVDIFRNLGEMFAVFLNEIYNDFEAGFPDTLLLTGRITRLNVGGKSVHSGAAFFEGLNKTIEAEFSHLKGIKIVFPENIVSDSEMRRFAQAYGTIYLVNQKIKNRVPLEVEKLTYGDKEYLEKEFGNVGHANIVFSDKAVAPLIRARAPRGSIYSNISFFISRQQVVFVTHDLGKEICFPRNSTNKNNIRYFTTHSIKNGRPVFYIHVTKAYFDAYLKNSPLFQASLLVHFYAERFLAPPYQKTRQELAYEKEQAFLNNQLKLDKKRKAELRDAVKNGVEGQKYLLKLINDYDIRKDPDRVYLQAIYRAITRLLKNSPTGNPYKITDDWQLLAWYRYMLESNARVTNRWKHPSVIIPEISKAIVMGVLSGWIDKKLVYSKDIVSMQHKDLNRYNKKVLFPYRNDKYNNGAVVFIPQCPLSIEHKIFDSIELIEAEKDNNMKQSLDEFVTLIRENNDNPGPGVETGLKYLDEVLVVRNILNRIKQEKIKNGNKPVAIGILGSASSGKTTLSELLVAASSAVGYKTTYLGADGSLYPGNGFRYDVDAKTKLRFTHIDGPGIYDDGDLARKVQHLKAGNSVFKPADQHAGTKGENIKSGQEVIVIDGVFLGLDKDVADSMDNLIFVRVSETSEGDRLDAKLLRDGSGSSTHKGTDLILDFAEKMFYETRDVEKAMPEDEDFIWIRGEKKLYIKHKSDFALPMLEYSLNRKTI